MSTNLIPTAKNMYVGSVRLMEPLARRLGLIKWLGAASPKYRWAHWSQSLFAIHDIDALVALDVPWWTYDAIDETATFLKQNPRARVFEYGSGASTIWLARRAGSVVSVEHDRDWHSLVSNRLREDGYPASLTHRLIESVPAEVGTDPRYLSQKPGHANLSFESYAKSILLEHGLFDLIVIDGRARGACLEHALTRLAPSGIIVFDNSRRPRYRKAIDRSGLHARRFRGLTPSLPYFEETTLLRHQENRQKDGKP